MGDQVIVATQGQMVRVPAGTTHAFAVKSETARVLNFYVPAGLDLQVAVLGTPATAAALPPEGDRRTPWVQFEHLINRGLLRTYRALQFPRWRIDDLER
jgi:hypothetical protein